MVFCILTNSGRMEKYLDLWEDKNAVDKTWGNLVKFFQKAHKNLCCHTSATVSSMENVANNTIMDALLETKSEAESQMVIHMANAATSQQNVDSKLQEISTMLAQVQRQVNRLGNNTTNNNTHNNHNNNHCQG